MQQQANGIMGAAPNTRGNSADASLGGMAQAVDTKVEAYRNNPQALEKRLAGNQQLLDLLALQKVKSEKESAANQLLLSEQQNPNTILEQREQEVLAMNKDEMAKQTAGILGQRQKQQQKNMQRTAKGAPQGAPIGAPEQPAMMAARGGLMPLPRPNMQRMAQGGIIGYDAGGLVTDELLAKIGITREEYDALPQAVKDGFVADAQKEANKSEQRAGMAEKLGQPAKNIEQMVEGVASIGAEAREKRRTDFADYKRAEALKTLGGQAPKAAIPAPDPKTTIPDPNAAGAAGAAGSAGAAGAGGASVVTPSVKKITPEPTLAEQARTAGTQGLATLEGNIAKAKSSTRMTDAMNASGAMDELKTRADTTGIPAAQKAAMAASDKNLGRSAKKDEINALVEEERGYTKSQLDPEKLRKERLMANLIGGGQRGLLGVAMGGQQADAQAAKFENSQRGKVVKMIQDRQKNDIDVAKIGEANARNVYSTIHAKSDAAMRAMVDISQADLEAADRAAAEFIARYDQEINVKFKEIDAKYKDKILEAQNIADQGKRLATLLTLYTEIQKSISEGLAYDTRYSSGAETAAKIQADPNYKFDDPEEKDDLAYYEGILARSTETQKSFDIVQKAIKKISGIDTTSASFNDD
jgi:hypothetical protein